MGRKVVLVFGAKAKRLAVVKVEAVPGVDLAVRLTFAAAFDDE